MNSPRTIRETHAITFTLSANPLGVTTYAPVSSATSIVIACEHEASGTVVRIAATADAIVIAETGAITAPCPAATFAETGRYRTNIEVAWGVLRRTYPAPALDVLPDVPAA